MYYLWPLPCLLLVCATLVCVPVPHLLLVCTTLVCVLFVATPTLTLVCVLRVCVLFVATTPTSTISVYYFSTCTLLEYVYCLWPLACLLLVRTTLVYVHYLSMSTVCGHYHIY